MNVGMSVGMPTGSRLNPQFTLWVFSFYRSQSHQTTSGVTSKVGHPAPLCWTRAVVSSPRRRRSGTRPKFCRHALPPYNGLMSGLIIIGNLGGQIGQGLARGESWAFGAAGLVLAAFVILYKLQSWWRTQ